MTTHNIKFSSSRQLGKNGPTVTFPALGGMSLSGVYGAVDDEEGVRVIHAYLDAGGTLIDTGDFYGAGHNEMLIARALRERNRDDVVLSVKFGALLTPVGMPAGFDGRPEAVKSFLTYSLQRLGTDHVDIYRPARVDPQVPIEETVGAVQELVEAGYVRHVGLSEVGADTIRRAVAVAPISDLQIEYSLLSRGIETNGILDTCREVGIGITAYSVLGRGLIGGSGALGGSLALMPRFQGDNLDHNRALLTTLEEIAADKGITLAQLAIAWVAARGEHIVPVIGSRRVSQVGSMIDANAVVLDDADIARIDAAVPVGSARGDRYPTQFMDQLDSERPVAG
ncbi:aldo/keto reductase [Nocardioides panzhihuensis]|uniref:Aryl-alcohol dehydrogenase-like predicted oxidoreductase n=1 Tax=Nocardioides panzhihuensis TaxID=860243 RepID=A0A7Z0IUZ9_9ACTN|nr:aldo/keto reductase [Nocardioides panzhihuensis]NYI80328.1 aryl-alcohol dehydrogenase-like predicted oxidoreductase [Nocardioides panzhihuensis]